MKEARAVVETMSGSVGSFVFAGHSLGGTAAFCLAALYPNTRSVSFNGGAVASNPVICGPGRERSTFYHVAGDLISSHMAPEAANVLRIVIGEKIDWNVTSSHSSANLIKPGRVISADEEQVSWTSWRTSWYGRLLGFFGYLSRSDAPIPGSKEWYPWLNNKQK